MVPLGDLVIFVMFITLFLKFLCQNRGEKIQEVVERKSRVNNPVETAIMDTMYGIVL